MCVEIVGAVEAITFQPLSRGREKLIFRRRTSVPFFSLFFFLIIDHIRYTFSRLRYAVRYCQSSLRQCQRSQFREKSNVFPIMFRFLSVFFTLRNNRNKKRLVTNVESPFNVLKRVQKEKKTYDTQT